MIKGALFTIGILLSIGSLGALFLILAAAMNMDIPSNDNTLPIACLAVFGIAVSIIVGACFL